MASVLKWSTNSRRNYKTIQDRQPTAPYLLLIRLLLLLLRLLLLLDQLNAGRLLLLKPLLPLLFQLFF